MMNSILYQAIFHWLGSLAYLILSVEFPGHKVAVVVLFVPGRDGHGVHLVHLNVQLLWLKAVNINLHLKRMDLVTKLEYFTLLFFFLT